MGEEISTDDLFGEDAPAAPVEAPEPPKAVKRAAKPKPAPKAKAEPVQIDNAIAIRPLDWQCACGNRNTHDLLMCGKCRAHRYTDA